MVKIARYKLTHLFKRMQEEADVKRQLIYQEQGEKGRIINNMFQDHEPNPLDLLFEFWTDVDHTSPQMLKAALTRAKKHPPRLYPSTQPGPVAIAVMKEVLGINKANAKNRKEREKRHERNQTKTDQRIKALLEYMATVEDIYMLDSEANLLQELENFKARKF